jgi:hypothetical protein
MIIFKILTGHCAMVSGTGETGFAGSNISVSISHPSEAGLSKDFSSLTYIL